jgi:hypothetical protein
MSGDRQRQSWLLVLTAPVGAWGEAWTYDADRIPASRRRPPKFPMVVDGYAAGFHSVHRHRAPPFARAISSLACQVAALEGCAVGHRKSAASASPSGDSSEKCRRSLRRIFQWIALRPTPCGDVKHGRVRSTMDSNLKRFWRRQRPWRRPADWRRVSSPDGCAGLTNRAERPLQRPNASRRPANGRMCETAAAKPLGRRQSR